MELQIDKGKEFLLWRSVQCMLVLLRWLCFSMSANAEYLYNTQTYNSAWTVLQNKLI